MASAAGSNCTFACTVLVDFALAGMNASWLIEHDINDNVLNMLRLSHLRSTRRSTGEMSCAFLGALVRFWSEWVQSFRGPPDGGWLWSVDLLLDLYQNPDTENGLATSPDPLREETDSIRQHRRPQPQPLVSKNTVDGSLQNPKSQSLEQHSIERRSRLVGCSLSRFYSVKVRRALLAKMEGRCGVELMAPMAFGSGAAIPSL